MTNLWLKADSITWGFWLILSTFHAPYQVYPLVLSTPITKYIPNLSPLLVPIIITLVRSTRIFCLAYRNSHLPVLFAFTRAPQHTFLYIIARNTIRSRNLVMLFPYRNPPIVFLNCDQGVSVWSAPPPDPPTPVFTQTSSPSKQPCWPLQGFCTCCLLYLEHFSQITQLSHRCQFRWHLRVGLDHPNYSFSC